MKLTKKQENKIFDLLFNVISIKYRNKNEYLHFLEGIIETIYILTNRVESDFIKRLKLMVNEYK